MNRTTPLVNGELYHICNKTVDGRRAFSAPADCRYFLETLLLVNTTENRALDWRREHFRKSGTVLDKSGNKLIEISALVLMPNHFHMVVRQFTDGGLSSLVQRLCNSFARYHNLKNRRSGPLFVGRFKAIHIGDDAQARHIFTYVHANPLDREAPRWREGELRNWKQAERFLKEYLWSSLGVYANAKTHSLLRKIISRKVAENYFTGAGDHLESIRQWAERGMPEAVPSNILEP